MSSSADIKKMIELTLLWEITKALNGKCAAEDLINSLNHIFQIFLKINSIRIWVVDEHTHKIKDFSRVWHNLDDKQQEFKLFSYLEKLKNYENKAFLINNEVFYFDSIDIEPVEKIKNTVSSQNELILPLIDRNEVFGLIEINCPYFSPEIFNVNFLISLSIAVMQVSTAISNIRLRENLEMKVDFQCLMKNIAKIIESQYEPRYVIPLIGEMIDRFVADPLIYIYAKGMDNSYKLIWPSSYTGIELDKLLKEMESSEHYIISEDGKIGLFPMISGCEIIGAIVADNKISNLRNKDIHYLEQLANQASITIEKSSYYGESLKQASLDALTGLNNRRQLEMRLEQETSIAKRKKSDLCCIMVDIDYFKRINDTYGHSVGDKVLVDFADILKEEIRTYDTAARYGGEEFCVLLPDTDIAKAEIMAQRLRQKVENKAFEVPVFGEMVKVPVTISVGISQFDLNEKSCRALYEHADQALYKAKREGRNKVIVYQN